MRIADPLLDSVPDTSTMSYISNETRTNQSFVSADQPMSSSLKPGTRPCPKTALLRLDCQFSEPEEKKGNSSREAIIIDSDPHITIGSETWLDKSIASSEILPNDLGL